MSSATPGAPFTPPQAIALRHWDIDFSDTPNRKHRTEKLFTLVEQTWILYNKIKRAIYEEMKCQSPSFEAVCLLLIKHDNDINHLVRVMDMERLMGDPQSIDPEIDALNHKLQSAVGFKDFEKDDVVNSHIDHIYEIAFELGVYHDLELQYYLYKRSSYYTPFKVGITDHSTDSSPKLRYLRNKFLESAHDFHKLQASVDEQVLIGRWYHPPPVSYRRRARHRPLATHLAVEELASNEEELKVERLRDVCNSFVVELTTIAKAANVPNYATLQSAQSDRVRFSPSIDWAYKFVARIDQGLSDRGMALANLIRPHILPLKNHRPTCPIADTNDVDYYAYQRLLGQNIGGISFAHVEAYFPLWKTVDAMVGVLADLLGVSFQKLDTSAAGLDEGVAAYDVSDYSEYGMQTNYLGRLYLELARKPPRHNHEVLPRLWRAKTLAHPEVETLQSPYYDPIHDLHRGGSVIVRSYWASQEDRDTHLQLDNVERLFGAIGSALHVLLVKHNRVRFNEIGLPSAFPVELQSMVSTVFGRLARHPAVLRRITRHPYCHNDRAGDATCWGMPDETIDGIVKCTQFETLRGALESLTAATMDAKIMTIGSVEEAKEFDVSLAWYESVIEIQSLVYWEIPKSGFATQARTTFTHSSEIQGYSYIIGEAIGLDIFTSKLASTGIFDNKREWTRFRETILSLSPTRKPDYIKVIENYLGRPINQDIFADCTDEVENQLEQQQAECEAALKNGPRRVDVEDQTDDSKEKLDDSGEQLDDSEEQLDKTKGTEEGPDDEYDVLAREEAVTV